MPHIKILKEMFTDSSIVPIESDAYGRKKQVKLIEPESKERKGYSVVVSGLPENDDVIVIKIDDFPAPNKIFKGSKGECRRADFVIVSDSGGKKVIVFIEMKLGSPNNTHIVKQLKGAQCAMTYTKEIGMVFWGNNMFLDGFESRFVSLKNISISKRKTRPRLAKKRHDTPETRLIFSGKMKLQFNQLT